MGVETVRVVHREVLEDALADLVCVFCSDLIDPHNAKQAPCGHAFCTACILHAVDAGSSSCPLDKTAVKRDDLRDLKDANPLVYRLLGRTEVRCENFSDGCAWRGELFDAPEHLRKCRTVAYHCKCCQTSRDELSAAKQLILGYERLLEDREQAIRTLNNRVTSLNALLGPPANNSTVSIQNSNQSTVSSVGTGTGPGAPGTAEGTGTPLAYPLPNPFSQPGTRGGGTPPYSGVPLCSGVPLYWAPPEGIPAPSAPTLGQSTVWGSRVGYSDIAHSDIPPTVTQGPPGKESSSDWIKAGWGDAPCTVTHRESPALAQRESCRSPGAIGIPGAVGAPEADGAPGPAGIPGGGTGTPGRTVGGTGTPGRTVGAPGGAGSSEGAGTQGAYGTPWVAGLPGTGVGTGDGGQKAPWVGQKQAWEGAIFSMTLHGHRSQITALTVSADGLCLFSGSSDGSLRVWWGGQCRFSSGRYHDGGILSLAYGSEDILFSCGEDKAVKAWVGVVRSSTRQLPTHCVTIDAGALLSPRPVRLCCVNQPTGRKLVIAYSDGTVCLHSTDRALNGGKPELVIRDRGPCYPALDLAVSGSTIVSSGSPDNSISMHTLGQGTQLLVGHSAEVISLAAGSNGVLFSRSKDGVVKEWHNGTLVASYEGWHAKGKLTVGPDGTVYCGKGLDGSVQCRRGGALVYTLREESITKEETVAVAIGRNGVLYSGERGGAIRVWQCPS